MIEIVIPMAGRGSRFHEAGYDLPKPLIDVSGEPMIARVVENITPAEDHRFTFVVQHEHLIQFDLEATLEKLAPGCNIVPLKRITRGAAETVLAARDFVGAGPLVIANSDQWVDARLEEFYRMLGEFDGVILTMESSDPKWSYVERVGDTVTRVVEKEVVSTEATVGIYGFQSASVFFENTLKMVDSGDLSKGEFYVAPVYNYLISDGGKIHTISIGSESDGMWGLGTPGDLDAFLAGPVPRQWQ